ncbi:FAD-dependent oxidoreductase [Mycobacterium sp. 94-17]|uniref:FAD-dependent oxidoreductase n=1 Tax=Mycobacterium sp. 94-17 TaxID=2986147 RepID=UPI002D1F39E8|nr:FAD-dependent monooxygenase [Mycobacterium sp. 94-17]MEB4209545.1 FAD-dependent monooxygenase [Mycobacterium sp. 94-17]
MTSGRAVVIGGSIGGLCAARALQARFASVTILEADILPDRVEGRRGTPQAWHNHSLLTAGREAVESLFPGFTDRLVANGGNNIDPGFEAANCLLYGWAPRSRTQFRMFSASRPMIELTLRQFVGEDAALTVVDGVRVQSLTADGDRVTGVTYRDADGQTQYAHADFVVDASGRGSRAATWMKEFGCEVEELTLDAKVSYSSRWYRWPADAPWYKWLTTFPDPDPHAPNEHQYICSFFPIEDNSFIAVMGSWGLDMPTDVASYEAAARKTRTREFSRILQASEPLTDVHHTRATRNVWRRFDRIAAPPRQFLAVGDAVCAFNPIYGQGMTCAATAAIILRRLADTVDPTATEFATQFYAEQAKFLKGAWTLALSRDGGYPQATGTEALPEGWRKRLIRKTTWPVFQFIADACWQDEAIDLHMNRVFNLQEMVTDVLRKPRVILGLARFGVRRALGRNSMPKPLSPDLPPSDRDFTADRDRAMGRRGATRALEFAR